MTAAVRGRLEASILMGLMANLPLLLHLQSGAGFPWKEHTATSVLTRKHLNATLCQCRCLRACLYQECISSREVRSGSLFFLIYIYFFLIQLLFAFDLDPSSRPAGCRFCSLRCGLLPAGPPTLSLSASGEFGGKVLVKAGVIIG